MGAAIVVRAVACHVWLHITSDLLDSATTARALDLMDKARKVMAVGAIAALIVPRSLESG